MTIKNLSAVALSTLMATTAMLPMSAFATQQPGVEYTGGDGSEITHLYLIADDTNLANNNTVEYNQLNAKVQVPVAINYVAQANGNITGPADNQAQIRNYSGFPVNVTNIKVNAGTNVTLVSTAAGADAADKIYLTMTPGSGTPISLADFTASATETTTNSADGTGKRPDAGAEWNIAAAQSGVGTNAAVASVLNLNSLSGKIGGFNRLDPAQKQEIGQIEWTVKPGTYAASASPAAPVNYGNVVESWDAGDVANTVTATLYDSGTMVVSGEGIMKTTYTDSWNSSSGTYSSTAPWWYTYADDITSVVIEQGITAIGSSTFTNCTNLTNISIADSVVGIGNSAFKQCTSLTSVTLPNSITGIGDGAFSVCSSLSGVNFSNNLTRIGANAFASTALTNVTLPDGVTNIGDGAFYRCTSLTTITIPATVRIIGNQTFSLCSSLTTINVGFAQGTLSNAPWGAPSATVHYNYSA